MFAVIQLLISSVLIIIGTYIIGGGLFVVGFVIHGILTGKLKETYVDTTPVDNSKYMPVELRNAIKPD